MLTFADGEDSTISHALEVLGPTAQSTAIKAEETGDDPSLYFFYAGGDEITDNLREFARNIPDEDNVLVILDIPSGKLFVSDAEEVTPEVVEQFVNDYQNDALEEQNLR